MQDIYDGSGNLRSEIREAFPRLAKYHDRLAGSDRIADLASDQPKFKAGDIIEAKRGSGGRHEGQRFVAVVEEVDNDLGVLTVLVLTRQSNGKYAMPSNRQLKTVAMTMAKKITGKIVGDVEKKNQQTALAELSEDAPAVGDRHDLGGLTYQVVDDENNALIEQHRRKDGVLADYPHVSDEAALAQLKKIVGRE